MNTVGSTAAKNAASSPWARPGRRLRAEAITVTISQFSARAVSDPRGQARLLDERPWTDGTVPGMAARSGSEFLERLSAARVHVEIQGETLTGGVAEHPAFRNVVRSYAELYDMQHDPAYRDILTYPSPTTGEPVATSFLRPRTRTT